MLGLFDDRAIFRLPWLVGFESADRCSLLRAG
jgi:hypothetical protein